VKALLAEIRETIHAARQAVVHSVDLIQVLTNFQIGRRIVEHEQQGAERAAYGKALLKELAKELTAEFGRGFSRSNLEYMRKFFLTYQDRTPQISQIPSGKFLADEKSQTASGKLPLRKKSHTPSAKFNSPFKLSWSQYVFLISIDNQKERRFYEIEANDNGWTLPELKRQFNSGLFERLALSRDQDGIRQLAAKGQLVSRPEDLLKEPYVLEFLGLDEKVTYSESDLETAIIDKIEHFLLELGKGFLFEARQKRFTFDEEHFFVDLVFYNRLLRCYVLIDLKIGKLTHANLGQMQMYVNYFDRFVKLAEENPTVGIVLCKKKHDALVEITLPEDANIHAREYQLYLPDKELLRRKLTEWGEEVGE
jgi:predicted nuclease of restriction endonuclease-like (RecB) superfamily